MRDLEIFGLYKSFGSQPVLKDLDLTVKAGSFTSILGPSGSGKTTLLHVIAGFERADSGSVRLGGDLVDDGNHFVDSSRRRIGYVPQDGSLFPHLSVQQNVGFGLPRRDRGGRHVRELLEMVGLGDLASRYPHQLSGGQQQRVALARALAIDPTLVLLDEPFSSLDANLRAAVRQDVRRVFREAGATAVLVTHDQDEALSLADEVAVFRDGRIGQYDTPARLYSHPSGADLAQILGESNFLEGTSIGNAVKTPAGVLDLDRLTAAGGNIADGSPLLVLVRPEQIFLSDDFAVAPSSARVVETEFYGHDAVVRLRAGWDDSTVIIARTADAATLPTIGAQVGVEIRGPVAAWPRTA